MLLGIRLFHFYSRRAYGESHCIPNRGAIAIGLNLTRNQDRRSVKLMQLMFDVDRSLLCFLEYYKIYNKATREHRGTAAALLAGGVCAYEPVAGVVAPQPWHPAVAPMPFAALQITGEHLGPLSTAAWSAR